MDWWLVILLVVGGLLILMATGLPIAFAFILVITIGAVLIWGGEGGLKILTLSMFKSIATFTLLPVAMFVLMGDVMFHSGIATSLMDALDKWLGRLPGRLGLLTVASGTLIATLSGSSMASCAILGTTLVPEMERRGYKNPMSLGPILGSGGLAIMIPPSTLAILLGTIGEISIGKLLIAITIPGLLMAVNYAVYIVVRCKFQPYLAPPYAVSHIPLSTKLLATARHILPLGLIVFLVTGVIFLGIATPTEASAAGALGTFLLAAANKKLNWDLVKKSVGDALKVTGMLLLILASSQAYGQILAFSGATQSVVKSVLGLTLQPLLILIIMQLLLLVLGMFMPVSSMMVVTLPLFMPIVHAVGFDTVWFGVIYLLNCEMASTTPPVGMTLFVMKSVCPQASMGDIYKAALPFLYCDAVAMAMIIAFPAIALWLPGLMR